MTLPADSPYEISDDPMAAARASRDEIMVAMWAVEDALASPVRGPGWAERLRARLADLRTAFIDHVASSEGPEGVHEQVLAVAPRLRAAVDRLRREHVETVHQLERLLTLANEPTAEGADGTWLAIRDQATMVVGQIVRHRQRGGDLLWEALEHDIGAGE